MPWTALSSLATGDLITETIWDNQIEGNLNFLSTHTHTGAAGMGSSSLGALVLADFTTAAAPAAPGASLGRFYVVTGDRPGFRAGVAGAAEELSVTTHTTPAMTATVAGHVPTPPNVATQFLNGQGVYSTPAITGHQIIRKTINETINNSVTLQDDNDFTFAIGSNETWLVQMVIYISAIAGGAAPDGIRITWHLPAGASMLLMGLLDDADFRAVFDRDFGTTPGTAVVIDANQTAAPLILRVHAVLRNAGTAGTATFQWAQNLINASDLTFAIDSFMVAHRV